MNIFRLRLILYFLLALITAFLLYQAVAPFGAQTYAVTPCEREFSISKLSPPDRVADANRVEGECVQRIIGEPAYFNVFTQRSFDEATVTVTYRTEATPVVELGVLADAAKNYRLQPLEHSLLDQLDWPRAEHEGLTLWQRRPVYKGVEHFTASPPAAGVRTYRADLPLNHAAATPFADSRPAFRPLRGGYRFYAAHPHSGDIAFDFTFDDLNGSDDADPVRVALYVGDSLIDERTLADARGAEGGRQRQSAGTLALAVPNAPEGVYTVAVTASDDIITTGLTTTAAALSFINRVHLAQTATAGFAVTTDIPEIAFSTPNPGSTQTVHIGTSSIAITEPFRQYAHTAAEKTSIVRLERDGLIIAGAGVIAFDESNLFNPAYRPFDRTTDLDEVEYILSSYRPQAPSGDWQTRSVTFDLTNALRYENRYGFLLSAPGLRADDAVEDWVEVKEVRVELRGKGVWEKIREMVVGLFGN